MSAEPDADPAQAFADAYRARFGAYHHAWSEFFVGHIGDLRRQLGDLDEALLLAAIGLGPLGDKKRHAARAGDPAKMAYAAPPVGTGPTNANRLAEVTGIPRETVRRKLDRFRRRGWVEQTEDGTWRIVAGPDGTAPLARDMASLHDAFLARLAALMAEFERLGRQR